MRLFTSLSFRSEYLERYYESVTLPRRKQIFSSMVWVAIILNLLYILRNLWVEMPLENTLLRIPIILFGVGMNIMLKRRFIRTTFIFQWSSLLFTLFNALVILFITSQNGLDRMNAVYVLIMVAFTFFGGLKFRELVLGNLLLLLILILFNLLSSYTGTDVGFHFTNALEIQAISILAAYFLEKYSRSSFLNEKKLKESNYALLLKSREATGIANFRKHLISHLAHDVKAPMNNMKNILSLIDQGALEEKELTDLISKMANEFERTSMVTTDMIHWVKSQDEVQVIQFESVNIESFANSIKEEMKTFAGVKGIDFQTDAPEGNIRMSTYIIQTVLRNIIFNAIKFSKQGDTITLSIKKSEGGYLFQVKDTGIGISTTDLADLRNKLSYISQAGTSDERGFGLGLRITAEMLYRHGSKLELESELGQGTTASFFLSENAISY